MSFRPCILSEYYFTPRRWAKFCSLQNCCGRFPETKRSPPLSWEEVDGFRCALPILQQRLPPLRLNLPRFLRRQRRRPRKFIDPSKRPAGVDDRFGVRGDAAFLVLRRNARIERRAPGVADDVDA